MQCHACGISAPSSAKYCPKCGAKIAESATDTGTPLHDSTVASLSHSPQQEATIGSSSPSHAEPQQNQPKHSILHNAPPGRKVNRIGLGIGLGLLVLILVGSGLFILLGQMGTQRSTLLQNPYPPHTGTLVLNNPLSWNSNGYYYWDKATSSDGDGCRFVGGTYHVTITQKKYPMGCLVTGNFTNFAYQVQMKIVRGDGGGIVLDSSPDHENFYSFIFNKMGEYEFDFYNNTIGFAKIASGHSSAFHTGLNQTNLVAAVAIEHSIDFYVNLQFVVRISDTAYGQIGVGASDVNAPTEVAFSNAKVWTIIPTSSQLSAAATMSAAAIRTAVTSPQDPYPPYDGILALQDLLSDNSHGYNWESDKILNSTGGMCQFRGEAYHASESEQGYFQSCTANATNFTNFAYQVQMTIVKGDTGGIIFRMDTTENKYYYFYINKFGIYNLDIYNKNSYVNTISGTIPLFHIGLNQTNLIAVVAQGQTIDLYVNLQFVAGVSDSSYSKGQISVAAEDDGTPTEVVFSHMKVWKL